jgi:hypothetical protein
MNDTFVGVAALLLATTAFAGLASGQVIGGGVGNVAPVITSVDIDDADDVVMPNAGTTRPVLVTAEVRDPNGYLDLLAVGGVRMALVFGGNDVIAEANAPRVSGSLLTGTYERTFDVPYYFAPGTYTIRVEATDIGIPALTDTDSTYTFTYDTLLSADPDASVELGSGLDPGEQGSIVPLSVENQGNAIIDVEVFSDGDLEHETLAAAIPIESVLFGTAANLAGASDLSASPAALNGFSLGVASAGNPSTGSLYFQLSVPDDLEFLPAGDYEAELTVTAIANA